jgi:CheY-like chemotaxis protein
VLSTLALSERQFYRDHTKAVQTLSGMLWERITGEVRPPLDITLEEIGSVESEAQRARGEPKQTRSDFRDILQGVLTAIQPLLTDRSVTFHAEVADTLTILDSDRTAARQIILLILSEVAARSPDGGSHLAITVPNTPTWCETTFTLRGPLQGEAESVARQIEAHESLRQLVHSIQGEICVEVSDNELRVLLRLPLRHEVILVIDDNPNIIRLFRRYVGNLPYQVVGADMYDNAISLARTLHPRCIILDVMLSGQDGWEILQNLKSHPATCSIPVLICSVLDIAELATSLGADAFIKKPPGQDEFVTILQRW